MLPFMYTSLTRISDLKERGFDILPIDRWQWAMGDYIVGKVRHPGGQDIGVELPNGRMTKVLDGDLLIGALGDRFATLEATGSWHDIGEEGILHALTSAGLLGKLTSKSAFIPNIIRLEYQGHTVRRGEKVRMQDFVPVVSYTPFSKPVILMVGTSMSAGKTTVGRIITHQLTRAGYRVAGGKLTGAGRYRDILSFQDAGAKQIYDFVDVGLPSSICGKDLYRERLQILMSLFANVEADVAVFEIGASPLEPYNGDLAIRSIAKHIKCTVLCASDPYAVYGVMKAFGIKPDIVSGVATNTIGGIQLIERLCGVEALNLVERNNMPRLREILAQKMELSFEEV